MIKNLLRRIKNKKRYFITNVNKKENDYKNNNYKNDDNCDDEDDEVEYIKVKKKEKRIKKTFNHQKKCKKSTKWNNRLYK